MQLTANNPASWLETLWEAVWDWEDGEPDSARIDDVKTAMAWLAESLGLEATADGFVSRDAAECARNGHRDDGRGCCADCGEFI